MHRPRPVVVLVVGLLMAIAGSAAPARADAGKGQQTWALVPATAKGPDGRASLEYVAEPGSTQRDWVAVRNFSEQPLTVSLAALAATQTTQNTFELLTSDDPAHGVGAWTDLGKSEVTVPVRDEVVVAVTLKVPDSAEPGDHAGGIVAVNQATPSEGGPAVQYRVGTRIYLRVAGAVTPSMDLAVKDAAFTANPVPVAPGAIRVAAEAANTGNVRLNPTLDVRVTALFGWWSAATVSEPGEVLPDGRLATTIDVPQVPPLGPVWVTIDLAEVQSRGQDMTAAVVVPQQTVVVWAVPWAPWAAGALVLAAGAVVLLAWRRRRRAAG